MTRVNSLTNSTKRLVFRFRLNASISSHTLISFGKQFHARGPYTANARFPNVSCLNFGTFSAHFSLDLIEYLLFFDGRDHFLDVDRCLATKSFEDDQRCFDFNPIFDWKPVKRNECRSYAIIFPQIETSLAAVFCTRWGFLMRLPGSPFIKLLQSGFTCNNACIIAHVASWLRNFWILLMLWRW